jgi:hypothetical protein
LYRGGRGGGGGGVDEDNIRWIKVSDIRGEG